MSNTHDTCIVNPNSKWIDSESLTTQLLDLFAKTSSRKEYLDQVAYLLLHYVECSSIGVRVLDLDKNIPYESNRGFSEEFLQTENYLSLKTDQCICTRVISERLGPEDAKYTTPFGSFHCSDSSELTTITATEPLFRGTCIKLGYKSITIIPIRHGIYVLGTIHLADFEQGKIVDTTVSLLESLTPLIAEAMHRFNVEEELQRNYQSQKVLNSILMLSHEAISLKELCQRALIQISSLPWLTMDSPAAIFLIEQDNKNLSLVAENRLPAGIRSQCAHISFGQCLCGKSASTQKILFSRCPTLHQQAGNQEDALYNHYCIPILAGAKTLGVIELFMDKEGHRKKEKEDFFIMVANTLSGIIVHRQAEENLQAEHRKFMDIIDFLPDATFVVDQEQKVIAWNRAIEQMTGIQKEDIIGKGDYAYSLPFYGTSRPILADLLFTDDPQTLSKYTSITKEGYTLCAENTDPISKDGKEMYVWASASPLLDTEGNIVGAIQTIRDITERKRMEGQLKFLATHDPLTNTANRYSLERNLERVVAKAKSGKNSVLLIIDIDNFSMVNETHGYTVGDQYLIQVADVLKNNLRVEDLIARLGGDEFAVLLDGKEEKEARIVADKLHKCIDAMDFNFPLTVTIGLVNIDGSNIDIQQILSLASSGLDTAKKGGKDRVVHIPTIGVDLSETNQILAILKAALKEDGFTLRFQPVVDIKSGKTIHHEVLLRLLDNEVLVGPGKFIPLAEKFGLMSQIDHWVVQASLKVLQERPDLKLFVNLSGISLSAENLLYTIEKDIQSSGINPSRLGFEVTETAVVTNMELAVHWIQRLKQHGCRFALDDFGIGFSSFSYLRILPVDFIKIDGFFIRNLDKDPDQRIMVQTISFAAHALGKKTIAEFVTNKKIAEILHELDIDYGQGYYLGEPVPLDQISSL